MVSETAGASPASWGHVLEGEQTGKEELTIVTGGPGEKRRGEGDHNNKSRWVEKASWESARCMEGGGGEHCGCPPWREQPREGEWQEMMFEK